MAVRVLSDSPIDVLRTVVRQHLGPPVWTPKDQLAFLMDPAARKPDPIQVVFADQSCMTRIDAAQFALKRIVLKCMRERVHHICAQLGDGPPNSSLFLTTDLYPIIAIQTDRAEHEDGTIQIHGHEMGIAILTAGQVIAQRARTLQRGDSLSSYAMETLSPAGEWLRSTAPFEIPGHLVKSISQGSSADD